jgi:hypothetical protein
LFLEELEAVEVLKGLSTDVEKAVEAAQPIGGEYGTRTRGLTGPLEAWPETKPSFEAPEPAGTSLGYS